MPFRASAQAPLLLLPEMRQLNIIISYIQHVTSLIIIFSELLADAFRGSPYPAPERSDLNQFTSNNFDTTRI